MKAIRLAFSFIRVPGLFTSLLLWPLVLGILAGVGQVAISGFYINFVNKSSAEVKAEVEEDSGAGPLLRRWIYGSEADLKAPVVCRWLGGNQPTDPNCILRPFDVTIRTNTPEAFNISEYESYYKGAVERIHLCSECSSNILVQQTAESKEDTSKTFVTSLKAMGVMMLVENERSRDLSEHYVSARSDLDKIKKIRGAIVLIPAGFVGSVDVTQTGKTMMLIINITFLILIGTWISLKSHRRVLDYFARNDALLPLVAACGKKDFYMALWWITILRVSAFLLTVLPATILVYANFVPKETIHQLVGNPWEFCLWLVTVAISLTAITLIASIAELRHRTSIISFLYKYIPFGIWILGSLIWIIFIFIEGTTAYQNLIASIPIFGLSAIILSPIIHANQNVVIAHALFSSILAVITIKFNSRWFAAHLEEL